MPPPDPEGRAAMVKVLTKGEEEPIIAISIARAAGRIPYYPNNLLFRGLTTRLVNTSKKADRASG